MNPPESPEPLENNPAYHSHKPGERRLSEDPVVFPEKKTEDCEPQPQDDDCCG
jgi:hypothetical protein